MNERVSVMTDDNFRTPPRGATVEDLVDSLSADDPSLRDDVEAQIRLGRQIAAARRAAGCTQRQLAERSGVRQATIAQIETGAGNPRWATLAKLCAALGIHKLDVDAA